MNWTPPDLMRKLSMKIDQRKTVQLSPEELDLLLECGAIDLLAKAALDFQRKKIEAYRAARPKASDQGGGQHDVVNDALARAEATFGKSFRKK